MPNSSNISTLFISTFSDRHFPQTFYRCIWHKTKLVTVLFFQ
ncbi:hypothetical protein HMPREF9370_1529 [Neisseria wadsworthii 9715]|uniref:Uncharacterized protein n=1 Tax=Neisseria wadsworthii 9715 TaxID=1030841 RepID=G4CR19_9NEIS|nr:hypothetical protein HMPREF9370_1529 [Neisseria wadsworthii 9715]